MAYLDLNGLKHFWNKTESVLDNKADTKDVLNKTGDSMQGSLDMDSHPLNGISRLNGTNGSFIDLNESKNIKIGTVDDSPISISGVKTPESSNEAANKLYVDNEIEQALAPIDKTVNGINETVSVLDKVMTIVKASLNEQKEEIANVNTVLSAIEEKLLHLNLMAENIYRPEYDSTTGLFTFYENEEIQTQFIIVGGSEGNNTSTTITIERITNSSSIVLLNNKAIIEYTFHSIDSSGDDTGDGTAAWYVGNTKVASATVFQGKNSFDVTDYLKEGANTVKVTVQDSYGFLSYKNWTITVVDFKIESTFDDSQFYSGEVSFRYTPSGDVTKHIYFELDGVEFDKVSTSSSGKQMTQTIPEQTYGSHLLKVYMKAAINGESITSQPLYKDIIWIDSTSTTPVIGCSALDLTVKQYNTLNIPYVVYDPVNNPANISLSVDDEVISALSVDQTQQLWNYSSSETGTKKLTIICGKTTKTLVVEVEDIGIDIAPVTTNLAFDFNPSGRSNNDQERLWTDGTYSMTTSDDFSWSNGGYQIDQNGDSYFCVKAGTTAVLDYKLFGDDAKKTGKSFKLIYKCTNVKDYDAQILSCYDNSIGFRVNAQNSILNSEQNELTVPFCEDNYMELEFNILPASEYLEMVMWIDAIPSRLKLYSSSDSFTQNTPQNILIGSDNCDVWIYRMKAYTRNLTDDEILDNYIADAKNADEMISRFTRNHIADTSGSLDPDLLAEKCPDLRIIKLSAPRFTTGKKNEISDTIIQQIYKNGRVVEDNWTAAGSHKGQGTSSEYYGESARNIDINCFGGFEFTDGSNSPAYAMTNQSVAENYFNIKVNVASSENANNAVLADEYHTFNPYLRAARIANSMVRDTMEFHPCVVFIKETDTANSTLFRDGKWHFYACGDFGNSKKNSGAMGMDLKNHKEFIIEILNNTDPQSRFLSNDLKDETWDGNTSFEFRYSNPNCTDEEIQAGKNAWQRVLSWVADATPEQFVKEFEDYFVKDSLLFSYLFTERHTMVDNRAKNVFLHTEDLIHWDACFDYDNDTSMGNDNEGGLTLSYGYEDTDTIGTKSVFNASDSKLWSYIRDYLQNDLTAMYLKLESQLVWSADRILKKMESYQSVKPERLWVADMRRKYFRTYEDNGTTAYLPMMHGDKKHQRRQFQKYQEKYIASKYAGAACTSDVITIRGYTPANWSGVKPDGTFYIKPYADTYIVNRFGSNITKVRGKRGNVYEIKCPIEVMNDTEVYTYNASLIHSIGDIAPFYAGYTDFNQGTKLTELVIGSDVAGYKNTNIDEFDIGRNVLLEKLNLQNLPNLKKTISLANCVNLEEFRAEGSGITGVVFAAGGKIKTAHLPAITSITGKSLYHLTDLTIESFENLTTLALDNCPAIDILNILNQAKNLSRARLCGISWNLTDVAVLERLYQMGGIDENGYTTERAVLTGKIHTLYLRESKIADYKNAWPDLEITYENLIPQCTVTFVNTDGTVLDVQYIDRGSAAEDPAARKNNPITVPHQKPTIETEYVYAGWDKTLLSISGDITITAIYTEEVRKYTVKYVSKGTVLQETRAEYGTIVDYTGEDPTYTAEEPLLKFYVFSNWDQIGYVDGDKTVNAVYDICEYSNDYFRGRTFDDFRPSELYAIMKMGMEKEVLNYKDSFKLPLGIDYSYSDVEQHEFVSPDAPVKFDGTNYIDTGISLFDKKKSFVLAFDYSFDATTENVGKTLMQCFKTNGYDGFRLWFPSTPSLSWGTTSVVPASDILREKIILQYVAGNSFVTYYKTNYASTSPSVTPTTAKLSYTRVPIINSTLVLGCAKSDDGQYSNFAIGTINWCKLWFTDLGDERCKNLALSVFDSIPMELAKFDEYYLSGSEEKRAPLTFLAGKALGGAKSMHTASTTHVSWAKMPLTTWLKNVLYYSIPLKWRTLIKPVTVRARASRTGSNLEYTDSYIYLPAHVELYPTTEIPISYEADTTIPYMTSNTERIRQSTTSGISAVNYWTRTIHINSNYYVTSVYTTGTIGNTPQTTALSVVIMFSLGV